MFSRVVNLSRTKFPFQILFGKSILAPGDRYLVAGVPGLVTESEW